MLQAAAIGISYLSASTFTVSANDFENCFFVNGTQIQCGVHSPGSVTLNESAGIASFSGTWIDLGQTTPNKHTVYFTEGPGSDVVSDILTWSASTNGSLGTISGTFESTSVPGSLGTVPKGATTWNENLGPFTFSEPFLTASVESTPTPEPATLLLLGTGLLGMGYLVRRKIAA